MDSAYASFSGNSITPTDYFEHVIYLFNLTFIQRNVWKVQVVVFKSDELKSQNLDLDA